MFSFQNIYNCYKECKKNKSNKINTLKFEANLLENLWILHDELNSKTYKIGSSICFLAHSPKLREIFAADFRDRVVHHVLIKEIEPFYERRFIYDLYSNRKNRGIHKAVKRAQSFMHRHENGYYLQMDIKGFFYNIDKNILFRQIFEDISKSGLKDTKNILYLANKIIYHNPAKNYIFKGDRSKLYSLPEHKSIFKIPKSKGLPIGNLSSQFFANIYMNGFDNYIKRVLKVKSYIRYVDDFVIFHHCYDYLVWLQSQIASYLEKNLKLSLKNGTRLRRFEDGLDFLGYIIRPNYLLVRKRVVNNYRYKKAKFYTYYENGGDRVLEPILRYHQIRASFIAHAKWANSYNLLTKLGRV